MLNPIAIGLAAINLVAAIVAFWILFDKAGIAGWKCLVPVYNDKLWMDAIWGRPAFVRRLLMTIAFLCSGIALAKTGGVTWYGTGTDFTISVTTPFTLAQSLAGLALCVSGIWLACLQIEANWYAADAFDGTLGTFLGLTVFGGLAYLWMAVMVARGKRSYLGTLDERIAAEDAMQPSYSSL